MNLSDSNMWLALALALGLLAYLIYALLKAERF